MAAVDLQGWQPVTQAVRGTAGNLCSAQDPTGGVHSCRCTLLLCGAGANLPSQGMAGAGAPTAPSGQLCSPFSENIAPKLQVLPSSNHLPTC